MALMVVVRIRLTDTNLEAATDHLLELTITPTESFHIPTANAKLKQVDRSHGVFQHIISLQHQRKTTSEIGGSKLNALCIADLADTKYHDRKRHTARLREKSSIKAPVNERWKHDKYEQLVAPAASSTAATAKPTFSKRFVKPQRRAGAVINNAGTYQAKATAAPMEERHSKKPSPRQPQPKLKKPAPPLLQLDINTSLGLRCLVLYACDDVYQRCEEFCATIGQVQKTAALFQVVQHNLRDV